MDYFKSLPDHTRKHLFELADRVKNVVPIDVKTRRISTRRLDPKAEQEILSDEVSAWMRSNHLYLYYFQMVNNPDLSEVEHAFLDAKARDKGMGRYSRFNRQSEFLYVGCSSNILKRFREHLGYGHRKTYSMQLAHWARDLDLELEFICAEYPVDTSPDAIQAIEDTLWDILLPMLGRRGKR